MKSTENPRPAIAVVADRNGWLPQEWTNQAVFLKLVNGKQHVVSATFTSEGRIRTAEVNGNKILGANKAAAVLEALAA